MIDAGVRTRLMIKEDDERIRQRALQETKVKEEETESLIPPEGSSSFRRPCNADISLRMGRSQEDSRQETAPVQKHAELRITEQKLDYARLHLHCIRHFNTNVERGLSYPFNPPPDPFNIGHITDTNELADLIATLEEELEMQRNEVNIGDSNAITDAEIKQPQEDKAARAGEFPLELWRKQLDILSSPDPSPPTKRQVEGLVARPPSTHAGPSSQHDRPLLHEDKQSHMLDSTFGNVNELWWTEHGSITSNLTPSQEAALQRIDEINLRLHAIGDEIKSLLNLPCHAQLVTDQAELFNTRNLLADAKAEQEEWMQQIERESRETGRQG